MARLHECHWVGVYFCNRIPVVFWQATDGMGDMQFMLAYYRGARVAQQLVVMQQAACYSVLYRNHANSSGVFSQMREHLLEGGAAEKLYLLALVVLMCSNVVERPYDALYCNPFHNRHFNFKKSRFHWVVKRDLIRCFLFFV